MIKILHTGDIHLDSPFSGLDSRRADVRRNELRAAFTSMMTYARTSGVDLILIAGDMFDGSYVTRESISLLSREFEKFGRPVFITPGNHDPASAGSIWFRSVFPKNVYVFTEPHLSSVELDGIPVTVYGYAFTESYMNEIPIKDMCVADKSRINLLCAHCDLGRIKGDSCCAVTTEQLDSFGADYAALGHIHNPPSPGHDGRWCYCGCLEGRGFDELGSKGACIVEIEKKGADSSVVIKKVRFSKKRYEKGELAVTGCSTNSEISERISAYISENRLGTDTLLSLRLTGIVPETLIVDTDSIENGAGGGLFFLQVEDGTMPDIDEASLESDMTITGELYRALKPSIDSSDKRTHEVGVRALRYALSALAGEKTF